MKICSICDKISCSLKRMAKKKDPCRPSEDRSQNVTFYTLSPIEEINGSGYFEALDEAIRNKKIKNVAVTGPYGSGKSSLLDSYIKEKDISDRIVRVSLANFGCCSDSEEGSLSSNNTCTSKDEKKSEEDKSRLEQNIEEHILQQIYHQFTTEEVPYSNFKRIPTEVECTNGRCKIVNSRIFILLWGVTIFFIPSIFKLLQSNINTLYYGNLIETLSNTLWFPTIVNIIMLAVFLIGIYHLIGWGIGCIKRGQLKKVVFKSTEINLSSDMVLNKYMNELIYMFLGSKKDTVIIEDLDRFDNITLFTRLREVNMLINQSAYIRRKDKVLTFIYAIKDDLFHENESRTKFFDLIIPVIPVVNTSNSGDKLAKLLGDGHDDISPSFLDDIGLYFYDFRLLKNIVNEYNIFKCRLNLIDVKANNGNSRYKLDREKLFAMVVYKNLFPYEFSEDQKGSGLLHRTFKEGLLRILKSLNQDSEERIKEFKDYNEKLKNDQGVSEDKLRLEYIDALSQKYGILISINNYNIAHYLYNKSDIDQWFDNSTIGINSNYGHSACSIVDFEKLINSPFTFHERLKNIKYGIDRQVNENNKKIQKEQDKININKRSSFKDLIENLSFDYLVGVFIESGVEKEKAKWLQSKYQLYVYLLRNGYLDENYLYYYTVLENNTLSNEDNEFLKKVKNNDRVEFDCIINNVTMIKKRIKPYEYGYTACVNKTLILSVTIDEEDNYLKSIIKTLCSNKDSKDSLIDSLIQVFDEIDNKPGLEELQKETFQDKILHLVIGERNNVWEEINNKDKTIQGRFIKYSARQNSGEIISLEKNSKGIFKKAVESREDIIDILSGLGEQAISFLDVLQPKFTEIQFCKYEENKVFQYIYNLST